MELISMKRAPAEADAQQEHPIPSRVKSTASGCSLLLTLVQSPLWQEPGRARVRGRPSCLQKGKPRSWEQPGLHAVGLKCVFGNSQEGIPKRWYHFGPLAAV